MSVNITAHVVIKHDRDTVPETHEVFGVYNNYRHALTAVLAEFGKIREALSLSSLLDAPGAVLIDTETETDIIWVDDRGLDSSLNFSITRAPLKEL